MKRYKLVSVLIGFALLFQGVLPVGATEQIESYAAEDVLAARLQAGITNHRILVISELSETSTTWVNPDGTLTTESFGSPIRVRDASGEYGWRDLDFTLIFDDSGFVKAKSGLYDLRVSGGGSASEIAASGLVSVSGSDGKSFGFGWDGGLPKPVLEGDTARFVDVLPQVDLLVRLGVSGFEQFFEVKARPDQATLDRLRLLVSGKNVVLEEDGTGGFRFVAGSKLLGSVPNPLIYDSADGASTPVTEELSPELSGSGELDLSVDAAFFARPDITYPVIVDPAVVLNPTFDTYVSNVYPTTDFQSATELLVGTPDGGSSVYRSYLNFDSSRWVGQAIISASLNLYLNWSWSCSSRNFSIYPTAPATTATRWANAPTLTGSAVAKGAAYGYNSSCPAATVSTDVTTLVRNMPVVIPNRVGFGIKASNESDSFGWKRFNSSDANSNKPSLSVTYNSYPKTPSTPSVVGGTQVNGVWTVGSWRPTLTSNSVDPDGGNVTLTFNSYADSGFSIPIGALCTVTVASGTLGSCRPSTPLSGSQTYYVKVSASDGSDTSLSRSAGLTFKVDANQPASPSISCPYSNGYQGGAIPTGAVSCTVSNPASTVSYKAKTISISIDNSAALTFDANQDGSFNQQVSLPAGAFQHVVTASAISAASVVSEPTTYVMSFGYLGIITPTQPIVSEGKVTLSSYAASQTGLVPSHAEIYWHRTGDDAANWYLAAANLPLTTKNGLLGLYNQDLNLTNLGAYGVAPLPNNVPVALDLKVCYFYPVLGESQCTDDSPVNVVRSPIDFSARAATAAGSGQVSLTNGKFRQFETDVSQQIGLDSLSVSRVFNANQVASTKQAGVLGTGWSLSLGSDSSALSDFTAYSDAASGHYYLMGSDGSVFDYTLVSGSFKAANKVTEQANLKLSGSSTSITVVELDHSQTTFNKVGSNWRVVCSKGANDNRTVLTSYGSTGDEVNLITGFGYSSGTCDAVGEITQGLKFHYQNLNSLIRLTSVDYLASGLASPETQVTYGYDNSGKLTAVTDNTNKSVSNYQYDSSGFLVRQIDSGFDGYAYKYDAANRLVQVQRVHPGLVGDVYSTIQTFAYSVSVSGNTGFQPDLPASKTSIWGQSIAPSYAAAVFGSDASISLDGNGYPVLPVATDLTWTKASFSFFDAQGYLVNTADYGATDWLYTASLLNSDGTTYASFDEDGISTVMARYLADGNANFDELIYASVYKYLEQINGQNVASNTFVSDSWSPIRTITDSTGTKITVRTHLKTVYDAGTPIGSLTGFITSQINGLTYGAGLKTANDLVLTNTVNNYVPLDGANPAGSTSGWILGKPTSVTTYSGLSTQISKVNYYYNSLGQETKVQKLDANGSVLSEINTLYYTGGTDTPGDSCDGRPQWQDLPCISKTGESTPVSSTWTSSYDYKLNPVSVLEYRSGNLTRTTTNTYLLDGRLDTSVVSASGAVSVKTKHLYDPVSLLETGSELYYDNVLQSQVSSSFDAWGREVSSTNSLGETTTTSYVGVGQTGAGSVASVSSPKTTTTYSYGNAADFRPLVTGMSVSGSNFSYQYSGVYDQFGRLTSQSGPNNLVQSFSFNDAGQLASMSYGSPTSSIYTWIRCYDAYGRVNQETDFTGVTTSYSYDPSSRLSSAHSLNITESYSYDSNGDRTSSTINGVSSTHTFNSESQLTNTGYVYDSLGRNTYIPSVDAPNGNGDITLSYNLIDQVTGISQNSTTTAFTYDVLGRRVNETSNGLTTFRHYTDSSDNPAWSSQLDGTILTTEIYTRSLGAGVGVITVIKGSNLTRSLQLNDLNGHTVNTFNLDTNNLGAQSSYDSFGNPQTSQTNNNLINYSSYSQQERATSNGGLILMGARVYNPKTNQFTSKDPIPGGNENPYTYPNDPINNADCNGKNLFVKFLVVAASAALGVLACLAVTVACVIAGVLIGGTGSFIDSAIEANEKGYKGSKWSDYVIGQTAIGTLTGLIGGGIAASALKEGLKSGAKKAGEITFKEFRKDYFRSIALDQLTSKSLEYEVGMFKEAINPQYFPYGSIKVSKTGGGGR